ncbi:MAG: hypothetical protein M1828_004247 [Chrysothrix sp. TS-e1954]|nr:MAG: hypothetical protein M1828_004247 [Chrysothrix sp. TS-e1954]
MAGTKRKATGKAAGTADKKQPKQDGQKAVSKDIHVPIDEEFHGHAFNPTVHIDEEGIIYDAALNQTNIGDNANKYYRLQLLKSGNDFYTHTRWGRVGEPGQKKIIGPVDIGKALKEFDKKFKDKSGNSWENRNEPPKKGKYTFLEKNYEDDSEGEQDSSVKKEEDEEDDAQQGRSENITASKLAEPLQRLVELIFNENHFNSVLENIGYNNEKLPLGKLGKSTLTKGFDHLKELESLIKHPKLAQNKYQVDQHEAIEDITNQYYSTIPHIFGRSRPPIIKSYDILQKEVAMLDTLTDMEVANKIMKTDDSKAQDADSVALIDQRFNQLNLSESQPLEHSSSEYQTLKNYLINTAGKTHNIRFRLQDIFRISRQGEDSRFRDSPYAKQKDSRRMLLWHGSRTTNYGGILSQGLRIAPKEAPVNGYAFGKGVYLADISTKSANYCNSSTSGGHGLLLLCEVELGNPMHELLRGDTGAEEGCKKAGCISTFGIGRTIPQGWMDAGKVHESLKGVMMPDPEKPPEDQKQHPSAYLQYNEYIAYDVAQIRLRYLLRFAE